MTDFEYAEKFLRASGYQWRVPDASHKSKKYWCVLKRIDNNFNGTTSTMWSYVEHDIVSRELWKFLQSEGASDAGSVSTLRRVMAACKVLGGAQ